MTLPGVNGRGGRSKTVSRSVQAMMNSLFGAYFEFLRVDDCCVSYCYVVC